MSSKKERIDECKEMLEMLYASLSYPLDDDEAWLRIEISMLIHDLKIIKERSNGNE